MESTDSLSLPGLNEELLGLLDTRVSSVFLSKYFRASLLPQSTEWSGILSRSREYDSKMVKYWQDELANLLTFVCIVLSSVRVTD